MASKNLLQIPCARKSRQQLAIPVPVISQHELSAICHLRAILKSECELIKLGDSGEGVFAEYMPGQAQELQDREDEVTTLVTAGAAIQPGEYTVELIPDKESPTGTRLQITLHRSATVVY
ncbi:MAG: hypothetical protein LAN62_03445 [Acidobacteriia bacterium]|nr:hypothetical protein [Terriglobia bacterium]